MLKKIVFVFLTLVCLIMASTTLEKAFAQHKKLNYHQAENFYKQALKEGANRAIVGYNLANLYYQTKRIADAIINYEKVIVLAPQFKNAYHNLGKIFFINKEYLQALKTFLNYNQQVANDWENLILIGDTYKKLNIFNEASRYYEKALDLDLKAENSYLVLAELYLDLLDKESAYRYLDLALENKVDTLKINEFKADLLVEDEEYFQAIFIYQKILNNKNIKLTKSDVYRLKSKIINNFQKAQVIQLAINDLRGLIIEFGESNDMSRLEEIYQNQNKGKNAFTFFQKIYPNNKAKIYPVIKNILITAYNKEQKDLINAIISFYEKNKIKDEVYNLIKYKNN